MTNHSANDRLQRLDRLKARLQEDVPHTIAGLAKTLGVSHRTLARDLDILKKQGLPIETDRGRGGGVRLDRNWGIGRLNLSYPEAVDLLISLAVSEQMHSPIFLAELGSVRRQLMASFAPQKRAQIAEVKSRILIGTTSSPEVQSTVSMMPSKPAVQRLHQAFLDQRALKITYKREDGTESQRIVEPHYLLLNYPAWYILAWDHSRAATRTFRCDRLVAVSGQEERFALRPKDDFKETLETLDIL